MSGSLRENVGKKDAKALRREDKVPCVMYGKGEQYLFAVPQTEFQRILFNPEPCFVEIDINGTKHRAMLKDIDFHPVTEIVYHCDFYELSDDKPIVMSIPVHTTGTSVGVMKGGKLVYKQKRLNVKSLPADMPSEIWSTSPTSTSHSVARCRTSPLRNTKSSTRRAARSLLSTAPAQLPPARMK